MVIGSPFPASDHPESGGRMNISPNIDLETKAIRHIQRERAGTFLAVNIETARRIYADDFQLTTPLGAVFSKNDYLGAVEVGVLRYSVLEFDSPLQVRVYAYVALVRHRTQIELAVQRQRYPRLAYWFADAYEKRDSQWPIVWSQGTGIAA